MKTYLLNSHTNLNIEMQLCFNIMPLVIAPISLFLVSCDNKTCSLSFLNFKLLEIILSSESNNIMEK